MIERERENSKDKKEEYRYPGFILRVQKAKKRDIGRNVIRVDPEMMQRWNIQTGDILGLRGKKESAGIAWPCSPKYNGLGIVRINKLLRKNTGTSIDDNIEIRKVDAKVAQNIILAPSNVKIRSNPKFESYVKRRLINYPVTQDDIILISIGISREISFKVISLRPKGICVIKQETVVHISEHTAIGEEKVDS